MRLLKMTTKYGSWYEQDKCTDCGAHRRWSGSGNRLRVCVECGSIRFETVVERSVWVLTALFGLPLKRINLSPETKPFE